MDETISILIIGVWSPDGAALKRQLTTSSPDATRILTQEAPDVETGIAAARAQSFDAIVFDAAASDPRDVHAFRTGVGPSGVPPILVVAPFNDPRIAVDHVRAGATDCFFAATRADGDLPQHLLQMVASSRARAKERESAAKLQDRTQFEQQLIGVVSHDLRNPLSTIRLSAQVLKARSKDEAQNNVVDRIIRATGQADRMIRDLVDFSQARSGVGIALEPSSGDVHAVVAQVASEFRTANPDRTLEIAQSGPGGGFWDLGRLAQLIGNLIGHAHLHAAPGTAIRVEVIVDSQEVALRFSSAGPVIPAVEIPFVFEPLRRGRSVKGGVGGSPGLGLFIGQEIARAHGGHIEIKSDDTLTTLTARLPLRVAADAS